MMANVNLSEEDTVLFLPLLSEKSIQEKLVSIVGNIVFVMALTPLLYQ